MIIKKKLEKLKRKNKYKKLKLNKIVDARPNRSFIRLLKFF